MANDTAQAAGAVAATASGMLHGARPVLSRALGMAALALVLVLALTAITLEWDGLATTDTGTPGVPRNAADAEQ